uniref:Cytochrome P450 n=1 Tax=Macrostomum lignano TaxID=282301 RepID=A0A1I8GVW3_9PLAT
MGLITGAVLLLYFLCVKKAPKPNEPPSPGWMPLVGSLPYMKKNLASQMLEGFPNSPLVTLYYGLEPVYILNNFEAFDEAMVKQGQRFIGRPVRVLQKPTLAATGELWREYRRFSLKTLRDFGFGRQGGEEIILREAGELCEAIDSTPAGQALSTTDLLSPAVSNVICQLVFGARTATEDPRFPKLLDMFQSLTQRRAARHMNIMLGANYKYFEQFSFLAKLMLLRPERRRVIQLSRQLLQFCKEQVAKHKGDADMQSEPRDYIDAHLQHQTNLESDRIFNDLRLAMAIRDLFVAGTDTTSNTLRWGILYMIENPDVAEKVFEEIRVNVGTERNANNEGQRQSALHGSGAGGVFPEPEKFKPERYLDAEARFSPNESVVPFGSGKRACLGESLARMELFVFFHETDAARYRFGLDPAERRSISEIKDNAENHGGGIRAPAEHKIVFTPR